MSHHNTVNLRLRILEYLKLEGPHSAEGKIDRVELKKRLASQYRNYHTIKDVQKELDTLTSVGTIKQNSKYVWMPGMALNDYGLYARETKEKTMKKASKKKASGKKRTPAQIAATKKLVALNKAKKKGKKKAAKKAPSKKKKAPRKAVKKTVAIVAKVAKKARRKKAASKKVMKARSVSITKPKSRKMAKVERTVTLKEIAAGGKHRGNSVDAVWICAGKKRTGCGGGAQGGHVLYPK